MGAIEDTHIFVIKLYGVFLENDFYHKTRGYNIGVQIVVDIKKQFIDVYVYVGLPSVNNYHVFKKIGLYQQALNVGLFDMSAGHKMMYLFTCLGTKAIPCFLG
jgi:hypothetical protein